MRLFGKVSKLCRSANVQFGIPSLTGRTRHRYYVSNIAFSGFPNLCIYAAYIQASLPVWLHIQLTEDKCLGSFKTHSFIVFPTLIDICTLAVCNFADSMNI